MKRILADLVYIFFWVLLIAFFWLGATGCGPKPDVTSTRGTESFFHGLETGMNKDLADAMESGLINGLEQFGYAPGDLSASLNGYSVDWQDKAFRCIGLDRWCMGQNFGGDSWVVRRPTCPFLSSYRHEMLHYFQWRTGLIDTYHQAPEWVVVNAVQDCEGGVLP